MSDTWQSHVTQKVLAMTTNERNSDLLCCWPGFWSILRMWPRQRRRANRCQPIEPKSIHVGNRCQVERETPMHWKSSFLEFDSHWRWSSTECNVWEGLNRWIEEYHSRKRVLFDQYTRRESPLYILASLEEILEYRSNGKYSQVISSRGISKMLDQSNEKPHR